MNEFDKKQNSEQHAELYSSIKELSIQLAGLPEQMTTKFASKEVEKKVEKCIGFNNQIKGAFIFIGFVGIGNIIMFIKLLIDNV